MVELSVIVPIYNVKNYLEECINSLLEIKNVKKQIICVEDSSTDGTDKVLIEKYNGMPDVEIYSNGMNSGLAFSRNVGLGHAKGKYIMFVDSDDYINSGIVHHLISKMNEEDLDILYFDVEEIGDINGTISERRMRRGQYTLHTGAAIFSEMVDNGEMFGSVWDGIYRKDFLDSNNINFINGTLHEDIPFTFKAMLNARQVNVIKQIGYFYRQRSNSILHQMNYIKRAQGLIIGYYQMMIVWQSIMNKSEIIKIEASIYKYSNSIVSMIESDINKSNIQSSLCDPIINSFLMNFNIKKNRRMEYIKTVGVITQLKSYSSIGLYGAGKLAEEIIPFLIDEEIAISNILVSNKEDNRSEINGIPVIEFNNEIKNKYEVIIVGVAREHKKEIVDYLKKSGFEGKIMELPID